MQRRTALKALAAAALAPWLASCSSTPAPIRRGDYDDVTRRLSAWLEQEMARKNVAGLSVALLEDQRLLWARGFGHAHREAGRAAAPETLYRAGSISKLFVALAALQLAEAGRLDLDAPLERYLPEFRLRAHAGEDGPITPRGILTHHAGLPSDYLEGMWVEAPERFDRLIPLLAEEYRAAAPGLVHAYSNLGFSLLGAALERIAGRPFEALLKERVLVPLGMKDSAFATHLPEGAGGAYDAEGKAARETGLRDVPAGGLNSTVLDLLRLARMLFNGGEIEGNRLLSAASLREMVRPQHPGNPLDLDLDVGLAWHFAPGFVQGGGPVLFHDGGTLHHRSCLMQLPEQRLAVAVMANSAAAYEVVMDAAGQALTWMLEARTGIAAPAAVDASPDPRHPPVAAAALPGHYVTEIGYVRVGGEGDGLRAEIGDERLRLTPRPDGYFGLEYRLLGLFSMNLGRLGDYRYTRQRLGGRDILAARHKTGAFYLAGERIEPTPLPAAWRQRLGEYEYAGRDETVRKELADVTLRLIEQDGFLMTELSGKSGRQRLLLLPAGDGLARLAGLGRGKGDTVRVDGDLLRHAGMAFRKKT